MTVIKDIVMEPAPSEVEEEELGPLLIMASGGSDSTALVRLVCDYCEEGLHDKETVLVLHINHLLRGEASDGDAAFTRALAAECGFAYEERRVDVATIVERGGGNLENVARVERYRIAERQLNKFCRKHGYKKDDGRILTAHTLDDRIETFMMRAIVGTGPGGLGSIPRVNGQVIRPLLDLTRDHLRAYLLRKAGYPEADLNRGAEYGLWREDITNGDLEHFRNYVRHEILPSMRALNPGLDDNMRRTMDLIVDESDFLDEQIAITLGTAGGLESGVRIDEDGTVEVDIDRLFSLAMPLRRRAVHALCANALPGDERIEMRHIEAIVNGADSERFGLSLPGNVLVRREYDKLFFLQPGAAGRDDAGNTVEEFDYDLAFFGTVILKTGESLSAYAVPCEGDPLAFVRANATSHRVYVDGDKILRITGAEKENVDTVDPAGHGDMPFLSLHVTNVRGNEAFCPLGMNGGHKRVASMLSSLKVPRRERARQAVVRAGDEIVWVCGIRLDDRFKVTSDTKRLIALEMTEK